ncbi:transcriptional regulator, HxlR family [Lentzea xinjiangensis]|uniref:Transcriptional regulator, HxlR family n=1 Tax=Lentzea xinjiangensis TaxID=402600 RepID=A0A1H9PDW4_9PSEU|nr:helix-turn-helix domain-containing protein [Lentzea xinjiangensis]SER46367.1 transcriptional regulator, HxlR family [Lentzea xinjiangensis]
MTISTEADTGVIDSAGCEAAGGIMAFVSRRWTSAIMLAGARGARRFGEYRRMVGGISGRMLSVRLAELEQHGLVHREVVPSMPVQVFYHLTDRGWSLIGPVDAITRWAHEQG